MARPAAIEEDKKTKACTKNNQQNASHSDLRKIFLSKIGWAVDQGSRPGKLDNFQ